MNFYCTFIFVYVLFASVSGKWNHVVESFHEEGIVPDLIETAPNRKLSVFFAKSGVVVSLGNVLKPSEVQTQPKIHYPVGILKQYYTLAFVDPDAPSRANPFERSFIHWLVGNIPQENLEMGDTLASFIGSAPPQNSGNHRYTFLLYIQNCKIEFNETLLTATDFEERKNFSLKNFEQKYNLGNPKFGNFYLAANEA